MAPASAACPQTRTASLIDGETYDAGIIATAPQHAGKLWPALACNFDYEPIVTVYLKFEAKTRLAFPLQKQSGKYGQWVVDRGNGLLACVLSGHGDWEALSEPNSPPHSRQNSPCPRRSPGKKSSAKSAPPSPAARASPARISRPLTRASSSPGDYTWADYPATLEGAVRSGKRAAHGCWVNIEFSAEKLADTI